MSHGKAWRIGGFIVAVSASAGLIASATGATGAYFTDTHPGSFTANSGHLTVTVAGPADAAGPDNLVMNFKDLYPGDYQTKTISYTTHSSSGNEDLWLVFPTNTQLQQNIFDMFTGPSSSYNGGGLGRFGHFAVADSSSGTVFSSYNLSPYSPSTDCTTDSFGHAIAGPGDPGTNLNAQPCPVPKQIRLRSGLADGSTGTVDLTFGLTGRQIQQNQAEFGGYGVAYQIVATQPGIRP